MDSGYLHHKELQDKTVQQKLIADNKARAMELLLAIRISPEPEDTGITSKPVRPKKFI